MSAAVRLDDMRTEVRRRSGMETADQANHFITDVEINALLNSELAALYDLIVENHDDDYYRASTPVVTQAGVDTYPLQADFYKIISVDVQWGTNLVRTAKRFTEFERNRYNSRPQLWSFLVPLFYRTAGSNLVIMPKPQGAVTLTVNYIPAFAPLVLDGDTFDSVNQWHEFAIWGAVGACRQKDDDDTLAAIAFGQQEKVKQRVVALAGSRNIGEAPRVQQTRRRWEFDE